jgi:hypothetical protein
MKIMRSRLGDTYAHLDRLGVSGLGVPSGLSLTDGISITDTAPMIAALLRIDRPEEWTGYVISEVVQHA